MGPMGPMRPMGRLGLAVHLVKAQVRGTRRGWRGSWRDGGWRGGRSGRVLLWARSCSNGWGGRSTSGVTSTGRDRWEPITRVRIAGDQVRITVMDGVTYVAGYVDAVRCRRRGRPGGHHRRGPGRAAATDRLGRLHLLAAELARDVLEHRANRLAAAGGDGRSPKVAGPRSNSTRAGWRSSCSGRSSCRRSRSRRRSRRAGHSRCPAARPSLRGLSHVAAADFGRKRRSRGTVAATGGEPGGDSQHEGRDRGEHAELHRPTPSGELL